MILKQKILDLYYQMYCITTKSIISFQKGGNECMTQQNDHGRQHAIALLLPLVSNYCTNLYLKAIGSVIV